ncbi:signal peptidase I [Haloarchaeobius sp. TZWWS8]|uniref:signal peptidase I n=1 Tax=Haloarchaeobius sp. TZWWS8 TaxID=3446121 RepID=UPI003EBA2648
MSAVALLLLVALVVPFVIYSVPQVVGADQSYVVLTGSMEPAISPGDVVVVAKVSPAAVEVGDVIIFNREGRSVPTTHRVIEIVETQSGERGFRTKGDANEDADSGVVTPAAFIGKISMTLPYVGYVVEFANSTTGFIALVLLPFALLILNELWSMFRIWRGDGGETAAVETDAGATAEVDAATIDSGETEAAEAGAAAVGVAEATPIETVRPAVTTAAGGRPTDDSLLTLTRDGVAFGAGVAGLLTLYSGAVLWIAYSRALAFQQFVTLTMIAFVASVGLLLVLLRAYTTLSEGGDRFDGPVPVDGPVPADEPDEGRSSATDGGRDVDLTDSAADLGGDGDE